MLKPKMMSVLIKGDKFDKLQVKDRKSTKRKLLSLIICQFFFIKISTRKTSLEIIFRFKNFSLH